MRLCFYILLAAMVSVDLPAYAAPSVFIRPADNAPWWNAEIEGRVLGASAGPITTDAVSAFIESTSIFNVYAVCRLEAVDNDTFVGMDRSTQEEIDQTEREIHWQIETQTAEGRNIVAQSVIYEACDDEENLGAALLIFDEDTNEVLRWIPMGFRYTLNGDAAPTWALFLWLPEGDELFGFSDCSECGARTDVYYDGRRKHIYTEYNGH